MSNETKWDVFLQLAKENRDLRMYDPESIEPKEMIEQDYQDWIREYDAALPDDLPVIPKAVGTFIQIHTDGGWDLFWTSKEVCVYLNQAGINGINAEQRWIVEHTDAFARAWVLGVWRVEETGKIVKLEAEK